MSTIKTFLSMWTECDITVVCSQRCFIADSTSFHNGQILQHRLCYWTDLNKHCTDSKWELLITELNSFQNWSLQSYWREQNQHWSKRLKLNNRHILYFRAALQKNLNLFYIWSLYHWTLFPCLWPWSCFETICVLYKAL